MRHGEALRREPQSSTIATPRFSRNLDAWNLRVVLEELVLKIAAMETPMYAISELFFGKCQETDEFQCWRVRFKTEVFVSTSTFKLTHVTDQ